MELARIRSSALGPTSVAAASSIIRNGHSFPSQISALAILFPQKRGYATEQSTSTSPQSYPPPGFNSEQAKKPLPLEEAQSTQANTQPPISKSADTAAISKATTTTKAITTEEQKSLDEEKKDAKKLTIGQKIKKEVQHYWDGTKLLATEVKISTRLAVKMAAGYELSRREHRQVCSSRLPSSPAQYNRLTL